MALGDRTWGTGDDHFFDLSSKYSGIETMMICKIKSPYRNGKGFDKLLRFVQIILLKQMHVALQQMHVTEL